MHCIKCWEEITGADIIVHNSNNIDEHMCEECAQKWLYEHNIAIFKWEYYNVRHPDIMRCDCCDNFIHRDMYRAQQWYCLKCVVQRYNLPEYFYCSQCGVYHIDWVCNWNLSDTTLAVNWRLSFSVRNDNGNWNARGEATDNNTYVKSIWQFQTERELPETISKMLWQFYHWSKTFKHYYTWEPIDIKGTVKYSNVQALQNIMDNLERERRQLSTIVNRGWKLSRYHNYKLQWIDDNWLVKWKYIDTFGNVRERSESINKFFEEFKIEKSNDQMAWEFEYRLSSDLMHKVNAFNLNEEVHSCQKSGNSDSYARWAYDAITNGCNCPILLFNPGKDKPFARITTRIMYDNQWQEYILIDRLYHSWQFSDQVMKWEVYKGIVNDLKAKWYKVIASNYSAHDNSTYSYLASLGMSSNTVVTDLCQPLRGIIGNCGYYCDWWTVVRKGTIDEIQRATDYLDKAYLL